MVPFEVEKERVVVLVHGFFDEPEVFCYFSEFVGEVLFDRFPSVVEHTVGEQEHQSQPLALVRIIACFDSGSVDEDCRRYLSVFSVDQVGFGKQRQTL